MITAIDTNVLIDVFGADKNFGLLSRDAIKKASYEGQIVACEVVWAEVASIFEKSEPCLKAMELIGAQFSPMSHEASLKAALAWRKYRQSGGKRDRIAADFLIGAHAFTEGFRLLTRDRGFYRSHFRTLKVWDPTES